MFIAFFVLLMCWDYGRLRNHWAFNLASTLASLAFVVGYGALEMWNDSKRDDEPGASQENEPMAELSMKK
jgi:hypothetical protein